MVVQLNTTSPAHQGGKMDDRGEALLGLIYDDVDQRLNPSGEDCWHCGGDGYVFDCFDGCCEAADVGCDDCTRKCRECILRAGERARAVREEVIKSGDVDTAIAWLKSIGRWREDISRAHLEVEIANASIALAGPSVSPETEGSKCLAL
jgi:hypothetical protein